MLDALSPGVNIIYGPNASGKTTFSHALQKLLRPQEPPHRSRSLLASFRLGGELFTIDYELGHTHCQRDGFDDDLPVLAPPDTCDRYVLALHDLIRSEDGADLAAEILRESAGGYDISAAKELLGYRDRPSGKGKLQRDLDTARNRRREAETQQDDLLSKERELAELREQRQESQRAADRIEWIDKAIRCHEAREAQERAQEAMKTFPDELAQLTGREVAEFDRLQELLEEAHARLAKARQKVEAAKGQLADSRLPAEGVPPGLVVELRAKCDRLQRLADKIDSKKQERAEAAERVASAGRALGAVHDEDALGGWDASIVEELARFAERVERVRATKHGIDGVIARLETGTEEQSGTDWEVLNQGLRLLQRWLARREDRARQLVSSRLLLTAAAITAACCGIMALFVHWSWLFVLVAVAGLAAWMLWRRQSTDQCMEIEREFRRLGLDVPGDWRDEAVQMAIRELQRQIASVYTHQEKTIQLRELGVQLQRVDEETRELEAERTRWSERLGMSIDIEGPDEAWLYYLVRRGVEYQEASTSVAAMEKSLEEMREQYVDLFKGVNEPSSRFGYPPANTPEQARGFVEDLGERMHAHKTARETIAASEETLGTAQQDIERWQEEQADLFVRCGLEVGQEATLREWVTLQPEYRAAAEDLRHARRDCESAEAALAGHVAWAEMSRDELLATRRESQQQADMLEELNLKIGGIEAEIRNAKNASDLEAALADEAECTEALRRQREMDFELVAGHTLADVLARKERERERPAVFKRAQELFVDITHGHFQLDIDDQSDPPAFRAVDTRQQRGLGLDELSSGTRLQLLLAVKLAFIERQEQGPKLPLILDETLANSDERRAREIIDAAIEVCRGGRQVFYLTAQYDEVGKWKQILAEKNSVPSTLVNLAEVRGLEDVESVFPVTLPSPPPPAVPEVDDCTWLEYGQRLGVPACDLRADVAGTHLWYLIDDLPALRQLLTHGITNWGQLQTLVQYGRVGSLGKASLLYRRAEARARLLEAAARYWHIGQGRPVDRQVLMESGAVSAKFIDRVADLADQLAGDAKALLAALEQGEVKGFRGDKRRELAEYLRNGGYLDQRDPLEFSQIRDQVRAVVFADLEHELIATEQFEELLVVLLQPHV